MALPVDDRPNFGTIPNEFDAVWFSQMVSKLDFFFERLNTDGPVRATTILVTELPTSAVGLPSGSLWNDTGTVKVAP